MMQLLGVPLVAVLVCSLLSAPPARSQSARPADAAPTPHFVIFGSSWADTGNLYKLEGQPTDRLYYKGRFSNGPLWVDYLEGLINPTASSSSSSSSDDAEGPMLINYAVSGSTACPGRRMFRSSIPFRDQVSRFTSRQPPQKDEGQPSGTKIESWLWDLMARNTTGASPASIIVMVGNNDYLRVLLQATGSVIDYTAAMRSLPGAVVECTMQSVIQLLELVAPPVTAKRSAWAATLAPTGPVGRVQNVMVAGIPPLDNAPMFQQVAFPEFRAAVRQAILRHNKMLQKEVQDLAQLFVGRVRVTYYDLHAATTKIYQNAIDSRSMIVEGSCVTNLVSTEVMRRLVARSQGDQVQDGTFVNSGNTTQRAADGVGSDPTAPFTNMVTPAGLDPVGLFQLMPGTTQQASRGLRQRTLPLSSTPSFPPTTFPSFSPTTTTVMTPAAADFTQVSEPVSAPSLAGPVFAPSLAGPGFAPSLAGPGFAPSLADLGGDQSQSSAYGDDDDDDVIQLSPDTAPPTVPPPTPSPAVQCSPDTTLPPPPPSAPPRAPQPILDAAAPSPPPSPSAPPRAAQQPILDIASQLPPPAPPPTGPDRPRINMAPIIQAAKLGAAAAGRLAAKRAGSSTSSSSSSSSPLSSSSGSGGLTGLYFSSGAQCFTPDRFFYYDAVHPSTRVHRQVAQAVYDTLIATGMLRKTALRG